MPQPGKFRSALADWRGRNGPQRLAMGIAFVFVYLLLDRSTVYFQLWSGISAWYPPVGMALALLTDLGLSFAPWFLLAGCLAGIVNYHTPVLSYGFLFENPMIVVGYTITACLLRRNRASGEGFPRLNGVIRFVLISTCGSFGVAALGAWGVLADGGITRAEYPTALLNWWAGDAVAMICLTPFLLVHVTPRLAEFAGKSTRSDRAQNRHEAIPAASSPRENCIHCIETAGQTTSIFLAVWIVFGWNLARSYEFFYLFFLPIIWIAVRRGLGGASAGILALNFGVMLILSQFPDDRHRLALMQVLMLIVSLTGLSLGALVSETKRIHALLQEREERFRLGFEEGPVGMAMVDRDLKFVNVNRAYAEMLGYTPEEMRALTVLDITHPADVDQQVPRAGYMLRGEMERFRIEKRYFKKSGEIVWVDVAAGLIRDAAGNALYGFGVAQNITERKHAEAELLRAKEAAESANRAKSEFLANMSPRNPHAHERHPRHGRTRSRHSPQRRATEYLRNVQICGETLLTLINDILDFSKIEAGKLELNSEPFNIREAITNVYKLLAPRAQQKSIRISCRAAENLPPPPSAMPCASSKCSPISSATPSNSPSKATSPSTPPSKAPIPIPSSCTSPFRIPASASPRKSKSSSSTPSPKPIVPPLAASAAPASVSPFAASSWN